MARKLFLLLLVTLVWFQNQSIKAQYVQNNGTTQLKLLCWNIYMLPVVNKGQFGRVNHITNHLKDNDYDVIVLQEVFRERIKRKVIQGLSDKYPFYVGPPGRDFGIFGQDGGVMIFSKYPIIRTETLVFRDGCKGADCLSQKGAVFAEIMKEGKKFQVVGTHLQSMEDKECQKIRDLQMCTIYTELLAKYQENHVPQFIMGDLNTECHIPQRYLRMLALLDAKDASDSKKYVTICPSNKFNGNPKNKATLDYVLFRANNSKINILHSFVKIFKAKWSEENDDLSDHYAVETTLEIVE